MQTTMYYYTTESGLFHTLKAGTIKRETFYMEPLQGKFPHVFLSSSNQFDDTADAMIHDVFGDHLTGSVKSMIIYGIYRIIIKCNNIKDLMPWSIYKLLNEITDEELAAFEHECYGEELNRHLCITTEPIPFYYWGAIERWDGKKWHLIGLGEFMKEHLKGA